MTRRGFNRSAILGAAVGIMLAYAKAVLAGFPLNPATWATFQSESLAAAQNKQDRHSFDRLCRRPRP